MSKVKAILAIIGGVAILVLGIILGGGSANRRGVRGAGSDLDDARRDIDDASAGIANAGSGVESVAEQLRVSTDRVDGLADSNKRSQVIVARGREILARAKARHSGKLDL